MKAKTVWLYNATTQDPYGDIRTTWFASKQAAKDYLQDEKREGRPINFDDMSVETYIEWEPVKLRKKDFLDLLNRYTLNRR